LLLFNGERLATSQARSFEYSEHVPVDTIVIIVVIIVVVIVVINTSYQ
jgi:hypothetical protein